MNIYFVNKHSKIKGPFDIKDAYQNQIIKIGDVCIHDTNEGLYFLLVVNNTNKWAAHRCISKAEYNEIELVGNTLLFSFDGIHKRTGKIEYLKWMSNVFTLDLIRDFFFNAIEILTYKCDFWDIEVFARFYSLTSILTHAERGQSTTERAKMQSLPLFYIYFNDNIKNFFRVLHEEGMSIKKVYEHIRKKYPSEFRQAMKRFIEENPQATIYDLP